jgi:hypothetical protein
MRLPPNEYAIETPIVSLILILVVAPLVFFGVRYEMKRSSGNSGAGKTRNHLSGGAAHLQSRFCRLSRDDLTKIGEDVNRNTM